MPCALFPSPSVYSLETLEVWNLYLWFLKRTKHLSFFTGPPFPPCPWVFPMSAFTSKAPDWALMTPLRFPIANNYSVHVPLDLYKGHETNVPSLSLWHILQSSYPIDLLLGSEYILLPKKCIFNFFFLLFFGASVGGLVLEQRMYYFTLANRFVWLFQWKEVCVCVCMCWLSQWGMVYLKADGQNSSNYATCNSLSLHPFLAPSLSLIPYLACVQYLNHSLGPEGIS